MTSIRISALLLLAAVAHAQTIQQSMELQRSGDLEGAARGYRAFLADHPNEASIRSNLGVVLARLGRYEEAEKEYAEALRLDPTNHGIELNLALAYYKSGRIPDAAGLFASLLPNAPDVTQASLLLADCYLRMGENAKVADLLQPLHASLPNDAGIAYLLGTALIRDRRVAEGQRVIDPILKNSDSPETHFLLGSQMFSAGNFPAAVQQFQTAVSRSPNLPALQSFYGQALLNTGDADGAEQAFRRELVRDPNDFDSNLRLAEILIERKKPEEAAPLLERALRVRPGSPQVGIKIVRVPHKLPAEGLFGTIGVACVEQSLAIERLQRWQVGALGDGGLELLHSPWKVTGGEHLAAEEEVGFRGIAIFEDGVDDALALRYTAVADERGAK